MVAHLIYSKNSPQNREAQALARQLQGLQVQVQLVDADSREGTRLTELYDLPGRPAVVLVRGDGSAAQRWQHQWPLASDISYLAHT